MVHGIIIAAMLTLVGDNGGPDQVPAPPQPSSHPAQVSMKAADWTLEHSPRLIEMEIDWFQKHTRPSPDTRLSHPLPDPQGGWSLSLDSLLEVEPSIPLIKLGNFEVNTIPGLKFFSYLVTTASPILTQGHYVKLVGGISARGAIRTLQVQGTPASCRMYFREVGDDPSSTESRYLYYRWWSTEFLLLHGGRFVQIVGLEPQFWSTLASERGDASAAATAGFQQALANPQQIGIWCRGAYVAGSGDVYHRRALVEPTFSMFSFAVCDPFRSGPTSGFADAPSAKQENEACARSQRLWWEKPRFPDRFDLFAAPPHLPAQGQQPNAAELAQNVVGIITGDKTKALTYCQVVDLSDELDQVDQQKDRKKAEELSQKIDELQKNLGPEYLALLEAAKYVDANSNDGQEIVLMFDKLDSSCGH